MADLLQNLKGRQDAKAEKAFVIPEAVLRQMTSCQSAANEFLRQFWSAVLPAKAFDITVAAHATPAQKAARAQKMIGYLERTEERVRGVLSEAQSANVDPQRVRFVCVSRLA